MTPGKMASTICELVAKVSVLESRPRCTHLHCDLCEREQLLRERVELRARAVHAIHQGPAYLVAIPNPERSEILGAMSEDEVRNLVSQCTTHHEQDEILLACRPDVRFRVNLYVCRDLRAWVELEFRAPRREPELHDAYGQVAYVSTHNSFLERDFSLAKYDEDTVRRLLESGLQVDHELRGKRPCIRCAHPHPHPRYVTRALLDAWITVDPTLRKAIELDVTVRPLTHDERYDRECEAPARLPRRAIVAPEDQKR